MGGQSAEGGGGEGGLGTHWSEDDGGEWGSVAVRVVGSVGGWRRSQLLEPVNSS